METQEMKKVIETEGVKLSADAIAKIFYLQHGFHKESKDSELNFENESANSDIEFINNSLHFLIELSKEDIEKAKDILCILWHLNDYKKLIELLKSTE